MFCWLACWWPYHTHPQKIVIVLDLCLYCLQIKWVEVLCLIEFVLHSWVSVVMVSPASRVERYNLIWVCVVDYTQDFTELFLRIRAFEILSTASLSRSKALEYGEGLLALLLDLSCRLDWIGCCTALKTFLPIDIADEPIAVTLSQFISLTALPYCLRIVAFSQVFVWVSVTRAQIVYFSPCLIQYFQTPLMRVIFTFDPTVLSGLLVDVLERLVAWVLKSLRAAKFGTSRSPEWRCVLNQGLFADYNSALILFIDAARLTFHTCRTLYTGGTLWSLLVFVLEVRLAIHNQDLTFSGNIQVAEAALCKV